MVGATKAYSGLGADIVMESITLLTPVGQFSMSVNAWFRQLTRSFRFARQPGLLAKVLVLAKSLTLMRRIRDYFRASAVALSTT